MRVLAAVDHFGTEHSAATVASWIADGVRAAGATCTELPLANGGAGTLAAFGEPNRTTLVMGPLGDAVDARWRLKDATAVIEARLASGLHLIGGADGNDAIAAGTHGVGELILAAAESGAKRIIVGVGGTAATDGGLGAIRAVFPPSRLRGVRLMVACDSDIAFTGAADAFAAAKGATPAQVKLLRRRLERLGQVYREQYNIDVTQSWGAGAGGGLAGGLAALGGELVPGAALIGDEVELGWYLERADLVITGEPFLDRHSLETGVVGHVLDAADAGGVAAVVVTGAVFDGADDGRTVLRLASDGDLGRAISDAVRDYVRTMPSWPS